MKPAAIHLRRTATVYTLSDGKEPKLSEGTTFTHLLRPAFWSPYLNQLSAGDFVRARAADGHFDVVLLVTGKDAAGIRVKPLRDDEVRDAPRWLFSATFTRAVVATPQDVFEITAPVTSRVKIKEIRLGQYSDPGEMVGEILSITILRGHMESGSGGSDATAANMAGYNAAPAAASTVKVNNTTLAAGGEPVALVADAFNSQRGWRWYARETGDEMILEAGQRLVVRMSAPVDKLELNGTLLFEEIGKPPTG